MQNQFEVEKLVGMRDITDVSTGIVDRFYQLKWKGYSRRSNSWQRATDLDCDFLVEKYHNKHGGQKLTDWELVEARNRLATEVKKPRIVKKNLQPGRPRSNYNINRSNKATSSTVADDGAAIVPPAMPEMGASLVFLAEALRNAKCCSTNDAEPSQGYHLAG